MNRIFSLGIAETAFLGVFFVAVCQLCATALVNMFGASENASSRTAYMTSLCLEELAADFVAHTPENVNSDRVVMDIKLFSDEDDFKVVIRNSAPAYNPLDFELNDQTFSKVGVKLAQKVSKRIEYTYVYRINIVTIAIAK